MTRQYIISEKAKKRSKIIADIYTFVLFAMLGYVTVIIVRASTAAYMENSGEILIMAESICALAALLVVLCCIALGIGVKRRRHLFKQMSGMVVLNDDTIAIGERIIHLSAIERMSHSSGFLRLTYLENSRPSKII